jgi:Tol biopolymer transport system component
LNWSTDGQGIFVGYEQRGPNIDNSQIGYLSSTQKKLQPITRDANSYRSLTVSADGRNLAAVQERWNDSFYVLPGSGTQSSKATPVLSQGPHFQQFNWTADGNLVAIEGGRLWRIGPGGSNSNVSQPLAASARIWDIAACGVEHLVFSAEYEGGTTSPNIWRTNADGSGAVKLTDGRNDRDPFCSPDQQWVYYHTDEHIFRVRLDGSGKPELVRAANPPPGSEFILLVTPMSISPDGETLAFTWYNSKPPGEFKLVLLNLKLPGSPRLLDVNPHFGGEVRFTPDAKSVAYEIRENGADNIWVQPLDGSPGQQITNFHSEHIGEFHWSPDGKSLGITRWYSESDVVLLQESKQ